MARNLEARPDTETVMSAPAVLDNHVMLLLNEIEGETVPRRLLELATALQTALSEQRQKRKPN